MFLEGIENEVFGYGLARLLNPLKEVEGISVVSDISGAR
jgi:hypothetical protein